MIKGDLPGTPKDMGPPKSQASNTIPISLGIPTGSGIRE